MTKRIKVTGEILQIEHETLVFKDESGEVKKINIRDITKINNSEHRDTSKTILGFLAGAAVSSLAVLFFALSQID